MAAAAGLALAGPGNDPGKATTYGVGELIRCAIDAGCDNILLGLGGSATNDAGAGMAAALGTRFLNQDGEAFVPTGSTLSEVAAIDCSETEVLLRNVHVQAMCDIDNGMYGPDGAAFVFAPQKGADANRVRELDRNLRAFAKTIECELGVEVGKLKGAGAAGAMGAGVVAFLGGTLVQGIDAILDMICFDDIARDCDYIVTGEGKLDQQSLSGKAVIGISKRAQTLGVPVIAVSGVSELDPETARQYGVTTILETAQAGRRHNLAVDDYQGALEVAVCEYLEGED